MGEKKFKKAKGELGKQQFVSNLLQDMQALEYMLHNQFFETGITRIGAEQEMCIIQKKSLSTDFSKQDNSHVSLTAQPHPTKESNVKANVE